MLESQAAAGTNVDLIVKGTIDGRRHGLLYQPGATNYQLDSTNSVPLTRAQLAAKISTGDTITIMGVPPGSGQRMAIDRDLNGVLDGDESLPRLQITQSAGKIFLSWPLSAAGFTLQETGDLNSQSWNANAAAVEIVNNSNQVTIDVAPTTTYFRLQQQ